MTLQNNTVRLQKNIPRDCEITKKLSLGLRYITKKLSLGLHRDYKNCWRLQIFYIRVTAGLQDYSGITFL